MYAIEAPLAHYVTYDVTPETHFDTQKLQQKTIEYKINGMKRKEKKNASFFFLIEN